MLKPQDTLVALKLATRPFAGGYAELARELGLSASETHAAVKRLRQSRLVRVNGGAKEGVNVTPNVTALEEFLLHGAPYVYAAPRGEITRGMPTASAAPPLNALFVDSDELPVWPDANGEARGPSLSPLYRSAPNAARRDPRLYELLALLDALRAGTARERAVARQALSARLHGNWP